VSSNLAEPIPFLLLRHVRVSIQRMRLYEGIDDFGGIVAGIFE
jgi:hypothetical protein